LEEIASLRRQNEEQRSELEQLRAGAMQVAPPLQRPNKNNPPGPTETMHRFMEFPLEIRTLIWDQVFTRRRLLGAEGIRQQHTVPTDLPVPDVGHVCFESRRLAKAMNHISALPGEFNLLEDEPPRVPAKDLTLGCWTWFAPSTDAFLFNTREFGGALLEHNLRLARLAEHIIVEDLWYWRGFHKVVNGGAYHPFFDENMDAIFSHCSQWLSDVYKSKPQDPNSRRGRCGTVCNLQNLDFAMREVTKIDRDCRPSLLKHLFGDDDFRIIDLGDLDDVIAIYRMLGYELSQGMDPDYFFHWTAELSESLEIYESIAEQFFDPLEPVILHTVASACFEASINPGDGGVPPPHGGLPTPFKDGSDGAELNMDVEWVRQLGQQLTVRPVHVFVRECVASPPGRQDRRG
jgi:hypothetical protein